MRDAARELADGLHLLALLKLFFGQAAGLHGVLVLGDVPEEDGEAFAGGERIERVPDTATRAERLERGRALVRHGFSKSADDFRAGSVQKSLLQIHADEFAPFGDLRPGRAG